MITIPSLTFGDIEIEETSVYSFPQPIPGLSSIKRYAILEPEDSEPFQWLQAVEKPFISLMMLDPAIIDADYKVKVRAEHRRQLQCNGEDQLFFRVLVVVPEDPHQMTANFLAPLIFHPKKLLATQIVADGSPDLLRVKVLKD